MALALFGSLFALTARAGKRKKRAREATLACGVFLFDDRIVIREGGYDRKCKRETLRAIKIRTSFGSGSGSVDYITLVGRDGESDVHTQLLASASAVVNAWVRGQSPQRKIGEKAYRCSGTTEIEKQTATMLRVCGSLRASNK